MIFLALHISSPKSYMTHSSFASVKVMRNKVMRL